MKTPEALELIKLIDAYIRAVIAEDELRAAYLRNDLLEVLVSE